MKARLAASKSVKVCPCGAPKDRYAKTCQACHLKQWEGKVNPNSVCECGNHKLLGSKTCRECFYKRGGTPRKAHQRKQHLKRSYGLSPAQVEEMSEKQGGKCVTCGSEMLVPDIDHCHTCSVVRGLLCHPCNIALHRNTTPTVLRALADYLEQRDPCHAVV